MTIFDSSSKWIPKKPEDPTFEIGFYQNTPVVTCVGDIDEYTKTQFEMTAKQQLAEGQNIIIDLSQVFHFSAGAVGSLVGIKKIAKEKNITISLVTSSVVKKVLKIVSLDTMLPAGETLESAYNLLS